MRVGSFGLALSVHLLAAVPAWGLSQPNGAAIPCAMGCNGGKPTGLLPVFACACTQPGLCNIGVPCTSPTTCDDGQYGTCESTMWHVYNDNTCIPTNHSGIDPWTDAAIVPETYHPTCALTYTVQSRGTAMFQDVFGWYNVTGTAPDPGDLHVMLDCHAAVGASVSLDLTKEPAWKGGDIGFFLLSPEDHAKPSSCAGGDCCATVARFQGGVGYAFYSEREFNPDGQGVSPFIHMLTFPSSITPQKYYFGWEDTYQTTSADFTNLVASVTGVECSGAGQSCKTGKQGACALGVTTCSGASQTSCQPVVQPSPEQCNGVDDDCDGQVDDGATCPTAGDVCDNGKCVPHCGGQEFPCRAGAACDPGTGLCVDPSCVGVACAAGQICLGGQCGAPCQGVVCPHGQSCIGTACVDLCAATTCSAGTVCVDGACIPGCGHCGGLTCAAPLSCDGNTGACADPSCPGGCPAGTYCSKGACVEGCTGVTCPSGQTCQAGQCVGPGAGGSGDGGLTAGDGGILQGADGGLGEGGGGPDGGATFGGRKLGGCSCHAGGAGSGAGALGVGLAVAAVLARRRRVCARRPGGRH